MKIFKTIRVKPGLTALVLENAMSFTVVKVKGGFTISGFKGVFKKLNDCKNLLEEMSEEALTALIAGCTGDDDDFYEEPEHLEDLNSIFDIPDLCAVITDLLHGQECVITREIALDILDRCGWLTESGELDTTRKNKVIEEFIKKEHTPVNYVYKK
jgi:hypothetical protein